MKTPVQFVLAALMIMTCAAGAARGQEHVSFRGVPGVASERGVANIAEAARREALARAEGRAQPPLPAPLLPAGRHGAAPRAAETPPAPAIGPAATEAVAFPSSVSATEPSPTPVTSFQAITEEGDGIPPDPHVAVGPNHIVITVNTRVRIFNRGGQELSTVSLQNFWSAGLTNISVCCDMRVAYDAVADRWMAVALGRTGATNSPDFNVPVGVSQTGDPTGLWNLFKIDADPGNTSIFDYPNLGFTRDWIITSGWYLNNNGGASQGIHLYAINKTNLYAGGAGTFTQFKRPDLSTLYSRLVVPAMTLDDALGTAYLISQVDTNNGLNLNQLRLHTITGPLGAEVLTDGPVVTAPIRWDNLPAPGPVLINWLPQLGVTNRLEAIDAIPLGVMYRNGSLWVVQNIYSRTAPVHCSIQWWQLGPLGEIIQRGLLDDPTGATNYAYPSLAVNQFNDVLIGYNRCSSNQYVSANYAFRHGTDPPNTLRADTLLKAGEAAVTKALNGRHRWGDYSATVVDGANDTDLWTVQEYAETPQGSTNTWGVWCAQVSTRSIVGVRLDPATVVEGNSGSSAATFTVRLHYPTNVAVSVDYATEDGSARAGEDYTAAAGTVQFAPGETNKTITIAIHGDTASEPAETIYVRLSNPTNAVFAVPRNHATILPDDLLIVNQPRSTNARPAATVSFAVEVIGPAPVTYQWRFNGADLFSATNSTLVVTNIDLADDGRYSVTLNDGVTTALSDPARLTVLINPMIVDAPLSQSVVVGGSVTLSVGVSGNPPPFGYQWRRGSSPLAFIVRDETNCFFALANIQTNQGGLYRVVITNAAQPSLSIGAACTLTVLADSDGDGLPDTWEAVHGFPTNDASNAAFDSDGDSLSNAAEYRAGTNPTNALSYLKVDSVSPDNGGNAVRLTFFVASNNTYTVESRATVDAGVWTRVTDVVGSSSNRVVEIIDPSAPGTNGQRYYRLVTPRVP